MTTSQHTPRSGTPIHRSFKIENTPVPLNDRPEIWANGDGWWCATSPDGKTQVLGETPQAAATRYYAVQHGFDR